MERTRMELSADLQVWEDAKRVARTMVDECPPGPLDGYALLQAFPQGDRAVEEAETDAETDNLNGRGFTDPFNELLGRPPTDGARWFTDVQPVSHADTRSEAEEDARRTRGADPTIASFQGTIISLDDESVVVGGCYDGHMIEREVEIPRHQLGALLGNDPELGASLRLYVSTDGDEGRLLDARVLRARPAVSASDPEPG